MAQLSVRVRRFRSITGLMMWCFPVQGHEARSSRAKVAKIPGGHRECNQHRPNSEKCLVLGSRAHHNVHLDCAAHVTSWPAPAGEKMSESIVLLVEGQRIPVYECRVSAVPFNQVWPGYQRPLDQTEMAAFAYWEMDGAARVEVQARQLVQTVAVRPSSLGIKPTVDGNRIVFELPRPRPVVVEINGSHHALHLFASPPERDKPAENQHGVRYFGPGVHRPGKIMLQSGETVYIAGGAVVHGSIQAHGAANIRVLGRGIIDCSDFERGKGGGAIRLSDCRDIRIEGVVMRDPDVWCCTLLGCTDAEIANVKLIGLWRYNSDGIDLCNSQHVTVRDCFVRSFDDSLVLKGLKSRRGSFDDRPVRDVRASGCVIWNDWGRAFEIGAETCVARDFPCGL